MGGVNCAREQDSSIGGDAGYVCLGAVHMEEEVQDRVQVEVGREEQGEGETHGKEQSDEQCESALFLEPKITSSLCDAVGSEDEKQTRTLSNGKVRHHN